MTERRIYWPDGISARVRLALPLLLVPALGWALYWLLEFARTVVAKGMAAAEALRVMGDLEELLTMIGFTGVFTLSLIVIFLPLFIWRVRKKPMATGPFVGLITGWFLLTMWAFQAALGVTLFNGDYLALGATGFAAAALLAARVMGRESGAA